jgi:hypothetical protein
MLARLFVTIGGLFVLALTAALVAPFVVDWSSYRADFEREASAILGRKVTVHGEASATILPFPSVTFSDVEVAGGPDGGPAMTAETFSMDAELAPLLSGEFRIFDMRLVRPKATIEVKADGAIDCLVRPSTPFRIGQISIEKLTITEGQVAILHAASGRTHRLTEINTEVSARALSGPWRMAGTMRVDGLRSAITVNTGRAGAGAIRLRIEAEPEVQQVSIESDGELRIEDDSSARYTGEFRLAARQQKDAQAQPQPSNPGFRVKGKFALDDVRLALDEFRFETGPLDNPYSADGSGFFDFGSRPRFALTLDGAQVRFDETIAAAADASGFSVSERISALHEALLDLPKPSIPGTVDINLPAVVASDTTIRDVRLSAQPASEGWTLQSLEATLPGRTRLEANGLLRTEGDLGFRGSLLMAIGQPSGFAAWVSRDVDDAIRRLPAAEFSANVDLTQSRQAFTNLELGLGTASFRGEAERHQPSDADPATILRLEGGAVDLDGLAALASLFISDAGVNRFAEGDLDLAIKAGPVSSGGFTAGTLDTAFRLRGGILEIDRLAIADLEGATVSATGTLRDFPDSPSGELDASIMAADMAPLIDTAAARFPHNALLQGLQSRVAGFRGLFNDTRLDMLASAAPNADGTTGIAVSAHGSAGGTAFSATISGKGSASQPQDSDLSLVVSARNDDATKLLALYGLPVLPLGLVGEGETDLSLKGRLSGDLATSVSLKAGGFNAGFSGTAGLADGLVLAGSAHLVAPDIEPWLMTASVALPGMGAGLPVELEGDVDYRDGLVSLERMTGTINQGALSGNLRVAIKEDRPRLAGEVELDELDLAPFAAMVVGQSSLEPAEAGWPSTPFAPQVSAPFGAELAVSAATVTAGPMATAYDARLTLRLDGEALRVTDLSAKLFDGKVTGLFELKNNGGTGLFSGQVKLEGADIRTALGDVGLAGTADISTTLSATGKSIGGLVSTLSGSGTAAYRGLVVDGFNTSAFPEFIRRADRIGKDIDAVKTANFASAVASSGSFAADAGEVAFTVAAGVLRAPPIKLTNSAAWIEANVQSDMNEGEVSISGAIGYDPGKEALVGSDPVVRFTVEGPIDGAVKRFDSEPLAQFLTQRALENEQARVEGMQAALLERQRLRREVRYYAALEAAHDQAVEASRRREDEERALAEARRRAEEEARAKAEAQERERRAQAEQARLAAEERARQEAEGRARQAAEEASRQAAEARKREAEAAARAEEQESRRRLEEQERSRAEAARRASEAAAQADAKVQGLLGTEERTRQDAEAARIAAEQEARLAQEARDRQLQDGQQPSALDFAPLLPPAGITSPQADRPQPKPDGFWEMLNGTQ